MIIGTGGYLSRLVFGRESAIEEERERLRKKQAKSLAIQQQAGATASDRPMTRAGPRRSPELNAEVSRLAVDATSGAIRTGNGAATTGAERDLRVETWPAVHVYSGGVALAKSANLGHTVPMQFLAVIID